MTKIASQPIRQHQTKIKMMSGTTRLLSSLWIASLACFAGPVFALHIIPDHLGDPHFTSGPCPNSVPKDGAACPKGATTRPAFYNPVLLPAGYNSVSYCAQVGPNGLGIPATTQTIALDDREQQAFLRAAQKVESYVSDDVTVVIEAYKVAYLDGSGNNIVPNIFLGNEYWTAVCG